jgi:hypothetical protein
MDKQTLRNGLVMLPPQSCQSAEVDAAPEPTEAEALMPGAVDLLSVTVEAWGPLREADPVPMPLDVRKKLVKLREDFRRNSGRGYIDAENQEWFALPPRWRMALLLMCGVDGDLGTLASRDFKAMPPPERGAIKSEVRLAKRHFTRMVALASLW